MTNFEAFLKFLFIFLLPLNLLFRYQLHQSLQLLLSDALPKRDLLLHWLLFLNLYRVSVQTVYESRRLPHSFTLLSFARLMKLFGTSSIP